MASLPYVFEAPSSKGSAIQPLLSALYYTSPSLVKAVMSSSTDDSTLSNAVKKAWGSLGKENSAQPVWDLIGEKTLIPADSAELLGQMCDLFDGELTDAATSALGVKSKVSFRHGARVKDEKPSSMYALNLSVPLHGRMEGFQLSDLLSKNFESMKVDYMFGGDIEPVEAEKSISLVGKMHEGFILQIQRYRYDFNATGNAKIYDRVEFPDKISGKDLASFADEESSNIPSCTFDLVAVLTHNDETGYGLLLRQDAKGPWFKCYDRDNAVFPMETSLESAFGGDLDSDVACMLFYKVTGGELGGMFARKMSRMSMLSPKPIDSAPKSTSPSADVSKPAADAAASGGGGCCSVQ